MKANQADAKCGGVHKMSQVLGVSPSGYYDWRDRAPCKRAIENAALSKRIEEIHAASDEIYGMPKICHELRDETDAHYDDRWSRVSPNRVARLMREARLRGVSRRRSFTVTTERDAKQSAASDLVNRQFKATRANELWVGDITYGTPRQRGPPCEDRVA